MEVITNLLNDKLKELTTFGVNRISYEPYNMDIALEVVERIGRGMNPKFKIEENQKDVYKQLIRFFHADKDFNGDLTKGIMLMGPTGSGKTMAMEIMRLYRQIDDTKFVINNKVWKMNFDIINVNRMIASFLDNGFDGIQNYCTRYLICMDDIGSEVEQAKYYGNNLDVTGYIIGERYSKRYLTLATTNFPLNILEEKYDDRIVSRMYALFNFVEMKGCDYRKK